METLIQFVDEVEDVIVATAFRIRRSLSLRPRERRQVPRLSETSARPTHVQAGSSR